MLGRLEMSIEECITKYLEIMKTVFSEKADRLPVSQSGKAKAIFDSAKLGGAVRKVIRGCGFAEGARLNDGNEHACKT